MPNFTNLPPNSGHESLGKRLASPQRYAEVRTILSAVENYGIRSPHNETWENPGLTGLDALDSAPREGISKT